VAVGPADIYWSNTNPIPGGIGHANINGGDVNQSLRLIQSGLPIPVFAALPSGLAVQGSSFYWANFGSTTIGRANLDGTAAQGSFIAASTIASSNVGVAVDTLVATCAGTEATIAGTGRSDALTATNGADVIAAYNGNDTVAGGGGNDLVCGSGGNDELSGGPGNDTLSGGAGRDTVSGGAGNDTASGGTGNDTVSGGAGNDTVSGGPGNDAVTGGPGKDTLSGGPGSDTINARDGNADRVDCGPGTDTATVDSKDTIAGASSQNPNGSCESVRTH